MGNTHRQKVTSKVIFLLHCTGLAQLSFYASLVGAYNFTVCNHTAIKTDYQNILQKIIANNLSEAIKKNIKNCCTMESQAKLLGCIYHFTEVKFSPSKIWNFTNALLKNHCDGNSEVNGSQNHRWTNCNRQSRHSNYLLLELIEMWNSYERY